MSSSRPIGKCQWYAGQHTAPVSLSTSQHMSYSPQDPFERVSDKQNNTQHRIKHVNTPVDVLLYECELLLPFFGVLRHVSVALVLSPNGGWQDEQWLQQPIPVHTTPRQARDENRETKCCLSWLLHTEIVNWLNDEQWGKHYRGVLYITLWKPSITHSLIVWLLAKRLDMHNAFSLVFKTQHMAFRLHKL